MTTVSVSNADTGLVSTTKEAHTSDTTATTLSNDDGLSGNEALDFEAAAEWVELEQIRLKEQHFQRANPVSVVGDAIRIDESAMLYDTVYSVELSDGTIYHVIFTSDGAIEIYEVAS